jgi:hypothetical protein
MFTGFAVGEAGVIKETIKQAEYDYKAPRPDTAIVVKY